jgi:hypothetical protein
MSAPRFGWQKRKKMKTRYKVVSNGYKYQIRKRSWLLWRPVLRYSESRKRWIPVQFDTFPTALRFKHELIRGSVKVIVILLLTVFKANAQSGGWGDGSGNTDRAWISGGATNDHIYHSVATIQRKIYDTFYRRFVGSDCQTTYVPLVFEVHSPVKQNDTTQLTLISGKPNEPSIYAGGYGYATDTGMYITRFQLDERDSVKFIFRKEKKKFRHKRIHRKGHYRYARPTSHGKPPREIIKIAYIVTESNYQEEMTFISVDGLTYKQWDSIGRKYLIRKPTIKKHT